MKFADFIPVGAYACLLLRESTNRRSRGQAGKYGPSFKPHCMTAPALDSHRVPLFERKEKINHGGAEENFFSQGGSRNPSCKQKQKISSRGAESTEKYSC